MPTKPLERLMFVQGGLCFFCREPLPKAEASVEHLFASGNGGSNNDENRVACCKAVNALLGSMSLKEKFQVVLNQKGEFKCPNDNGAAKVVPKSAKSAPKAPPAPKAKEDKLQKVLTNLEQRGNAKPSTLKTLRSTIAALFPNDITDAELSSLLAQLQSKGKITVTANKVSYKL